MLSINGLIIMFMFGILVGVIFEGISSLRNINQLRKATTKSMDDLQDSYNFAIGLLYERDMDKLNHYTDLETDEEKLAYRKEIENE